MEVGVRELKSKLSQYLALAKKGEQITVTERGRAIAVIVPLADSRERIHLGQLARDGVVSWNGGKPRGIERPLRLPGTPVSQIVLEDRR